MPIGPNIAILGAGNRLAALPVLATVFNLPPDMGDLIALYDRNAEMLDLFDRVARAFAAYNGIPGISILATESMAEATKDADAVFICIDIGDRTEELAERVDPADRSDPRRDPFARVEVLRDDLAAISKLLDKAKPQLVFNLVYGTEFSGTLINAPAFHLDWPPRVPEEEQYVFAHRALRLVRGDEPIFQPLQEYKDNPLATAIMDSRPPPENRYDPEALTRLSWELRGR